MELVGDHPDVLSAYADARLMANQGAFDDETIGLIARALRVDPDHIMSLWLAGTHAYQHGEYEQTLEIWQKLSGLAEAGSEMAATMTSNIAEVRAILERAEAP